MPKYLLLGPTAPTPGCDEEYNRWYDETHLPQVCSIPNVISGRRFEIWAGSPAKPDVPYMAIYELETDDPTTVLSEIERRASTGELELSPAIDGSSAKIFIYKERSQDDE